MSNSPLVNYTRISPNRNSPRNHKIDTITIHCMAGQLSVETCGNVFAPVSRQASSNYGIGPDGRVGMYVEEKDRSWCSSSAANDNRAVTIEVASDSRSPYTVTNAALQACIDLCVDICQRNGITALIWSTDKNTRVNHLNGANMTVHRDYSAKSCPGDYLYARMGQIASAVNSRLGGNMKYVGTGIGEGTALEEMAVRDDSSTKGTKVGEVRKGEKVEILSRLKNGWLKIVWPGSPKGYAYTSNAGGGYYAVTIYGEAKTGTVVNCYHLNVRATPGGTIVGTLNRGDVVTIEDEKAGWLKISSGWVSGAYIQR